jgi:hypothetical protein
MSGRGLDVNQINASQSAHRVVAPLIDMFFDGGTLRLTPWRWDIVAGANTYTRAPVTIEKVRESATSTEGYTLAMNGLDPAIMTIATSVDWNGRTCTLSKAYLQADSNQMIGTAKVFFVGRFRNYVISEDNQQAAVSVFIEHFDVELDSPQPLRLSDADQQRLFPGDLGCSYAASNSDKSVVWPSKEAQKFKLPLPSAVARRLAGG